MQLEIAKNTDELIACRFTVASYCQLTLLNVADLPSPGIHLRCLDGASP